MTDDTCYRIPEYVTYFVRGDEVTIWDLRHSLVHVVESPDGCSWTAAQVWRALRRGGTLAQLLGRLDGDDVSPAAARELRDTFLAALQALEVLYPIPPAPAPGVA